MNIFKIIKTKILYKKSFKDEVINTLNVSFLNVLKKTDKYRSVGVEFVKNGKYAVVIMAGGMGSRLGLNIPKGCIKINDKSLFEIYVDKLKKVNSELNIEIPIYIMTSKNNNISTQKFFKSNNFFSYPQDKVKFFVQDELPILNKSGKVVNYNKSILMGPNGNGDVFKSLKRNNLINDMKLNNIEYALFVNIDNPLNNLVDFDFIGATIAKKYKLSSKTIKLDKPNEWIFIKYNKRPYMLPLGYIGKFFNKLVNGEYLYRYKNISYHLIHIDLIEKFSKINLKYHRAYKLTKIDKDKEIESFKFEKFIFDAFYYADDMLLYETDNKEFYPIKNIKDLEYFKKNNH
ncbi:MAG: UTP--glucose-1-phosphate uridylyltransferase [Bacilli bacterium]|nr:UTP--glucose-1-phosphate uridylyltransferase [Bacilli bacterium]